MTGGLSLVTCYSLLVIFSIEGGSMPIGTGFIKLHRAILNSEVFQNDALFKVWIWCLLKASYKKYSYSIPAGKGTAVIDLEPGQFIFGRKTAALELKMTEGGLYERIQKLKNSGNITVESNNRFSIITIVKWITYQDCTGIGNSENMDEKNQQQSNSKTNNKNNSKSNGNINNKNHQYIAENTDTCNYCDKKSNNKTNSEPTTKPTAKTFKKQHIQEVKNNKEKRIENTSVFSSAELEKNSSSPDPEISTEVFIFKIPLNDKTEFGITQKDYDKWQDTFPAVDVMAQLKRMALWCDDNPKNRKTSRGVRKFISSWLSKEQDRAQRVNPGFKKYDNAANIKKMMEEFSDD
jgi:hypothetical protein